MLLDLAPTQATVSCQLLVLLLAAVRVPLFPAMVQQSVFAFAVVSVSALLPGLTSQEDFEAVFCHLLSCLGDSHDLLTQEMSS